MGELLEDNELLEPDVGGATAETGDKLVRVKRGRGDSRYNPENNPNRGRKRIRNSCYSPFNYKAITVELYHQLHL